MDKRLYTLNDNYFDQIDTEEKAYFLGLLFTDGCNYEDRHTIKLDLIEDDAELLFRLKDAMQYTGTISHYDACKKMMNEKEVNCKASYRILLNSKHMSQKLADYGMISHKSLYGKYIKDDVVPISLFNHFVRGLIDGDGGISYWIDNENTQHKKFQINFCSTEESVRQLAGYFGKEFNCCPAITDRRPENENNNLQFTVSGNKKVRAICDWLYKDATIYSKRKYNNYIELINENERVQNDKKVYGSAKQPRKVVNLLTKKIYENMRLAAEDTGLTKPYICVHAKKKNGWMYYEDWCLLAN